MEIKKIEKSDFVMFPRMQHRGLQFRHVERDAYRAELRHVEGHGDYWLLHQQSKPHVVAHVQLPKTEAEFDNILGFCLGQNHWCEYIEGCGKRWSSERQHACMIGRRLRVSESRGNSLTLPSVSRLGAANCERV